MSEKAATRGTVNQTAPTADVAVEAWLARPRGAADVAALEAIFFSSSGTQQFSGPAERASFRERWLGRYLLADATHVFVAVTPTAGIVGYVIGSLDDIGRLARFADLASARQFAEASARYPAHLHINVAADHRSSGIGARLIEVFAAHAAMRGACGMHVVTSAASRNVRFYQRCGFHEAARIASSGGDKVLLARGFQGSAAAAIKSA